MSGASEITDLLNALGNTSIGHLIMAIALVMVATGALFVWGTFRTIGRGSHFNEKQLELFGTLSIAITAISNAMPELKEQTRLARMAVERSTEVDEQTSAVIATNTAAIDRLRGAISEQADASQSQLNESLQIAIAPLVTEMGELRKTIERVDQKSADRLGELAESMRVLLEGCKHHDPEPRPIE